MHAGTSASVMYQILSAPSPDIINMSVSFRLGVFLNIVSLDLCERARASRREGEIERERRKDENERLARERQKKREENERESES